MERARLVGGGLLGLAAVLLLVAAFKKSWWEMNEDGILFRGGFGLLGWGDGHDSMSYGDFSPNAVIKITPTFLWIGRLTFAAALLTALTWAGTIVLLLLGKPSPGIAWRAAVVTAGSGLMFVFVGWDVIGKGPVSFGAAFYLFWLAAVAGLAGDQILVKMQQSEK